MPNSPGPIADCCSCATLTPTPTPTLAAGCPATPIACADTAGKNTVRVKPNLNASRSKFQWNWKRGTTPLLQTDLGDPVNGSTSYTLCLYDQSGPTTYSLAMGLSVAPGGTCGTRPCWKALGTTGWTYRNRSGDGSGVTKLVLRGGSAGRPSLQLAATGASLPLPTPVSSTQFFHQSPTVIAQLHGSNPASCWSSTFDAASTKKNDGRQFKAVTR